MPKTQHRSISKPLTMADRQLAVRLRRMTDKELVDTFKEAAAEAADAIMEKDKVETLLSELSAGLCKGVKGATAWKIQEYAKQRGFV